MQARRQVRAAALIQRGDSVLLHRPVSDPFWAAPGGKVEAGEYAADALRRELTEELGIAVHVGRLREWSRRGSLMMGRVDEVGLYFTVDVGEVATDALGRSSQEDTLEVAWFNLRDLDRVVVRPPCLVEVLTTATGFPVHLVERGPDVASRP